MLRLYLALLVLIGLNAEESYRTGPVLLVSLSGLRADKLDRFLALHPNSTFNRLVKTGVKADYMVPVFPPVVNPNLWTIVTGTN